MVLTVLMALAAYRVWRIFGLDVWPPSRALRDALEDRAERYTARAEHCANVGDTHGATRARRLGVFWNEMATMVECPWCLGFWISGAVVVVVDLFASVPLPLLQWFAVACLVGLIGSNLDGE